MFNGKNSNCIRSRRTQLIFWEPWNNNPHPDIGRNEARQYFPSPRPPAQLLTFWPPSWCQSTGVARGAWSGPRPPVRVRPHCVGATLVCPSSGGTGMSACFLTLYFAPFLVEYFSPYVVSICFIFWILWVVYSSIQSSIQSMGIIFSFTAVFHFHIHIQNGLFFSSFSQIWKKCRITARNCDRQKYVSASDFSEIYSGKNCKKKSKRFSSTF